MAHDLELTLMLADYHRTRPLLNGEVTARGIKLQPRRAESGEACMRPVYEEFDIAEMSLSWYMMARCRNEPVIALPIFSAAHADSSLHLLLGFFGNRATGRSQRKENRHG